MCCLVDLVHAIRQKSFDGALSLFFGLSIAMGLGPRSIDWDY